MAEDGKLPGTESALARRLLPEPNPEDPERCELHRFIMAQTRRFRCPETKEDWVDMAPRLRSRFLQEVYFKGLSLSLLDGKPQVKWRGTIETNGGYRIRRLLYEGYPGMWIPALFYEPTDLQERAPGVMNPNGHHTGGKSMEYKQARCINLAKRGMLALSTEFIGMGELSMNVPHNRIGHMDLCGSAGVAIFYLAMKRGLDVLLSHPRCDPERVAVTGLSGGGWQTIILGALDERIKVVVPVAGHSPIWQRPSCTSDIGDLEQNPTDFCTVADYDTLTALCAPRPLLLIYNRMDDCCFKADRTRISIFGPVLPLYELLGVPDNIEFYENADPGTHNYETDNRSQLYRFLNKHFGLDTPNEDLPYEDELLSESQLEVGVPEDNHTLLSLAGDAARDLPVGHLKETLAESRRRLEDVIGLHSFSVSGEVVGEDESVVHHRLRLDDVWTVPVTWFNGTGQEGDLQVLLADGGRRTMAGHAQASLAQGRTVVAADVFGTGESNYPSKYQMTMGATGVRPLGVLTGQILGLLKWMDTQAGTNPCRLAAFGTITSFASLCSAALRPDLLSHLYMEGLHNSLKRLIDLPIEYDSAVPLFCFGLLREFDVYDILRMTQGLPIEMPARGPVKPLVPRT